MIPAWETIAILNERRHRKQSAPVVGYDGVGAGKRKTMVGKRNHTLEVAAQMYECRATVKRFLGKDYPSRMQKYAEDIRAVAKAKGCDELKALHAMAPNLDGMARVFMMAAYVEMVEPS